MLRQNVSMTIDDTVAGQDVIPDDDGQWSPCLDNSIDDMDDTIAGQDIELDDAGLSVPGAQLRSAGLLDDDGQLLAADRRQRLIPVRPVLLLNTKTEITVQFLCDDISTL